MTLRRFLLETRSQSPVAVRSAMVRAIATLGPARLKDRRSYSSFYGTVVGLLRRPPGSPLGSMPRANGSPSEGNHAIPIDVAEESVTYRRLAMQVIQRAFKDMEAPACPADDRKSARDFLAGSPMLFHWCNVAELDPRRVMARATMLGRRRPTGT